MRRPWGLKKGRVSQILSKTLTEMNVFFFDPGPYFFLLKKTPGRAQRAKARKGSQQRKKRANPTAALKQRGAMMLS